MLMLFMGPCECRVRIAPDAVVSAGKGYSAAWQRLADAVKADPHSLFEVSAQSFPHSTDALAARPVRYETVTDDTPMLPAHVLDCEVRLDRALRAEILAAAVQRLMQVPHDAGTDLQPDQIDIVPATARVRLYYDGVMIVWFEIDRDQGLGHSAVGVVSADELHAVEQLGIVLLQELAARIDERLASVFAAHVGSHGVNPVTRLVGAVSPHAEGDSKNRAGKPGKLPVRTPWTVAKRPGGDDPERGPALWVTRSLIVEGLADGGAGDLPSWLDPVSQGDWRAEMAEDGFSMQWLRYAFDEAAMRERGMRFDDAWESMLFCQFFWAALERVEHQMFRLLGRINSSSEPSTVRESYTNLDRVREQAELTLAHHRHLKRYLTRVRFQLVNKILKGWGFQRLVDNLHDVIAIARTRHEQLLQRAAARSSVFTDLLLFAIGSVAVLDFFVGLSMAGRQLASDSAIGRRDEGWFDILGFVSSLRMDTVFSLGASIIIVVALLLFWYRRRQLY